MLIDDSTLDERVDVELPLEDRLDQPVGLHTSESLVLGTTSIQEFNVLVLVLQLDQQLLFFSSLVKDIITKVDNYNHLVLRVLRMFECFPF